MTTARGMSSALLAMIKVPDMLSMKIELIASFKAEISNASVRVI
jgi:hypothetical protein